MEGDQPDSYEDDDSKSMARYLIPDGGRVNHNLMYDEDWHYILSITNDMPHLCMTWGCPSSGVDTYLRLYDDRGNLITQDDDGGDGFCSLINQTLPFNSYFYYQITDYRNTYACYSDYQFNCYLWETEPNDYCSFPFYQADRVNSNGSSYISSFLERLIVGTISTSSDVDWFAVYGGSGTQLKVRLAVCPEGGFYNLDLNLYRADCSTLVASSRGGNCVTENITYKIPSTGWYNIKVYSYSGTGLYYLYVSLQ